MTPTDRRGTTLGAGVVAFNDADRLRAAVRSLLDQELPPDVRWSGLWLVVSPSDDATESVATQLARDDPRIHLIVEPARRGKSAALARILAQVSGDAVVLLNGDAVAAPGAVAALLEGAPPGSAPYAVMARPVPAARARQPLDRVVDLLWSIHHRFHVEILESPWGTHLSDELMLISLGPDVPLREGIVNDGAFVASWLRTVGGRPAYAPEATVWITTPADLVGFLRQRARIRLGHRQIARLTGVHPTTIQEWGLRRPRSTLRMLRQEVAGRRGGPWLLASLMILDALAIVVAAGAVTVGRGEPIRWDRSRGRPWDGGPVSRGDDVAA